MPMPKKLPDVATRVTETISARARKLLQGSSHPELRQIVCRHHGNVLTLEGRVRRYYHKQLAQVLVSTIEGVEEVENHIDVED